MSECYDADKHSYLVVSKYDIYPFIPDLQIEAGTVKKSGRNTYLNAKGSTNVNRNAPQCPVFPIVNSKEMTEKYLSWEIPLNKRLKKISVQAMRQQGISSLISLPLYKILWNFKLKESLKKTFLTELENHNLIDKYDLI